MQIFLTDSQSVITRLRWITRERILAVTPPCIMVNGEQMYVSNPCISKSNTTNPLNRQLVYRCEAKVGRSSWYCLVMYWGLSISPSLLALQNFPFCHQSSSDDRRHLQTVVRCRDLKWSNERRTCDENDFQKESAPGARTLGPGAGTPAPRVNGARAPTLGVGNPILGARTPVQRA